MTPARLTCRALAAWIALTALIFAAGAERTARAGDAALTVKLEGINTDGRFADRAAFCPPPRSTAKDVSPGVAWTEGPPGTRSYALTMTDPDVPADLASINRPDVIIPRDAPRTRVFHWVLADIPPSIMALAPGVESDGLIPGGKPIGLTPHGVRGANVFTTFLAGVKGMAGTYGGYDGPCPPTNDQLRHRYVVRVVAVDLATLGLTGAFTGEDVERALAGHILAEGEATGIYALDQQP